MTRSNPQFAGHTCLYALVRAQTRTFVLSRSSNSFLNFGSGLIYSSKGRVPSHFWSKSRGSEQQNIYHEKLGATTRCNYLYRGAARGRVEQVHTACSTGDAIPTLRLHRGPGRRSMLQKIPSGTSCIYYGRNIPWIRSPITCDILVRAE